MCKRYDACPLCGYGKLEEKVVDERFTYEGHSLVVLDYHILECPACGEALVVKESARQAEMMLRDLGRVRRGG